MFSGRCDGVTLFPVNHQRLGVTRRRPERGCLEAGGWWWPHVLVAGVGSSELSRRGAAHTPTTRPRGGGFGSYSGGRRVSLPFDCQTPTPTSDPTPVPSPPPPHAPSPPAAPRGQNRLRRSRRSHPSVPPGSARSRTPPSAPCKRPWPEPGHWPTAYGLGPHALSRNTGVSEQVCKRRSEPGVAIPHGLVTSGAPALA